MAAEKQTVAFELIETPGYVVIVDEKDTNYVARVKDFITSIRYRSIKVKDGVPVKEKGKYVEIEKESLFGLAEKAEKILTKDEEEELAEITAVAMANALGD